MDICVGGLQYILMMVIALAAQLILGVTAAIYSDQVNTPQLIARYSSDSPVLITVSIAQV